MKAETIITAKELAKIAEKTPGYTVTMAMGYGTLTNIRFRRTESKRKDTSVVLADCSHGNGYECVWPSDTRLRIED